MAYLTEKEKSILFSAITREEKVCKEHGFDDLVKVCQRLLHVFSYNRLEKHIRNKAIDEFAEKLKDSLAHNYRHFLNVDTDGFEWITTDAVDTHIQEIAKKMKGE